jgi:hypothetical protein
LVASGSGSAAARTRAHPSRSSGTDTRRANSTNRCSSAEFAATAAEITAACVSDTSPRRSAPATPGWFGSRAEVSNASLAAPVDVPDLRANSSAAVLAPAVSDRCVCPSRRASNVFPAAHNRSDLSSTAHNSRAVDALTASGSNRSTKPANRSRTCTASWNMCSSLEDHTDNPPRNPQVRIGRCCYETGSG